MNIKKITAKESRLGIVRSQNAGGTYDLQMQGDENILLRNVPSVIEEKIPLDFTAVVGFYEGNKQLPVVLAVYTGSLGEGVIQDGKGWDMYSHDTQRTRWDQSSSDIEFILGSDIPGAGAGSIIEHGGYIYGTIQSGSTLYIRKFKTSTGAMTWEKTITPGYHYTAYVGNYALCISSEVLYLLYTTSASATTYRVRKMSISDGSTFWDVAANTGSAYSGLLVGSDGIYLGTSTAWKLSLVDGNQLWTADNSSYEAGAWNTTLLLSEDGLKIIINSGRYVIARDRDTGSLLWATALDDATWTYTSRDLLVRDNYAYGFYRRVKNQVYPADDYVEALQSRVGANFFVPHPGSPYGYFQITRVTVGGIFANVYRRLQGGWGGAYTSAEALLVSYVLTDSQARRTESYLFRIDLDTGEESWKVSLRETNYSYLAIDNTGVYCAGYWFDSWQEKRSYGGYPVVTDTYAQFLGDYLGESVDYMSLGWNRKFNVGVGFQKRNLTTGGLIYSFDAGEYFSDYLDFHANIRGTQIRSILISGDRAYVAGTQLFEQVALKYPFLLSVDKMEGNLRGKITWVAPDTFTDNALIASANAIYGAQPDFFRVL